MSDKENFFVVCKNCKYQVGTDGCCFNSANQNSKIVLDANCKYNTNCPIKKIKIRLARRKNFVLDNRIDDYTKSKIIQFMFGLKNNVMYLVERESGNSGLCKNLFVLRKRNPENIVFISKRYNLLKTGIINQPIGDALGVNDGDKAYFTGFQDKVQNGYKSTFALFKFDEGKGWYSEMSLPVERILELMDSTDFAWQMGDAYGTT